MTHNRTKTAPCFPAAPARRLVARVVADCDGNLTAASLARGVDRTALPRLLGRERCARTRRTGPRGRGGDTPARWGRGGSPTSRWPGDGAGTGGRVGALTVEEPTAYLRISRGLAF